MDNASGSSHKGKSLKSYTITFKLKVIEFAKANNNSRASKVFSVDRKRVIEWRKMEENVKQMENRTTRKRKSGAGRPIGNVDIDTELIQWIERRRAMGGRVTGVFVRREARRLHQQNGNQSFRASSGWLSKFMKRHNISFRRTTHIAQKLPEELDLKRQNFFTYIIRLRRQRNYPLSHIGNMDETPIWMDMPGTSTIEKIGEKTVTMKSTGHEKNRITVMLAALADGSKLPPLVIFKGVRPPKDVPNGVIVEMAPKSWANEEIISRWLQRCWRKNNLERRLLVWDSYSAHITAKIKESVRVNFNSDMAVIPGGCTSKLQPCDVSWNKPFKSVFREFYDDWLVDGPIDLTRGGNRKSPTRELMLQWIKDAWATISPDLIRKSFVKCGISSGMDGSQDDAIFQSSDDEDPFEGFTEDDLLPDADLEANNRSLIPALNNLDLLQIDGESDPEPSEREEDDYICPNSPGH